jgi:hypothetical protein
LRRKNQMVDAKKEACQKDSRIRGTKERSREKIPGSGISYGKKDFRIRQTKEWSRKEIPGPGGQCGLWWGRCSVGNQEGTSPSMRKRGA